MYQKIKKGIKKRISKVSSRDRGRLNNASGPSTSPSERATPSTTRRNTPAREGLTPRTPTPQAPFSEGVPSPPSPQNPAPSLPSHSQSPLATDSPSSSPRMLQTAGKVAFKGAQVLKETLEGVPDMGILKGTLGGLIKVVEIIQQKREAERAFKELDDSISELCSKALKPLKGRQEIEIPSELKSVLISFAEGIQKVIDTRNLSAPVNDLHAYISGEENMKLINELKSKITVLLEQSIFETQLTATLSNHNEKMKQHVRNLRVIPAAYNYESPGSTSSRRRTRSGETAAQALKVIDDWIDTDSGPNILIVHGLAGVGKTTIAQTIAESRARGVDNRRRLGASFFFSRDQTYDHKAFFPTIAYQLAKFDSLYVPHLGSYLDSVLRVEDSTLHDQASKMIIEPLSKIPNAPVSRALIILDALDEFDQRHASLILDQLLRYVPETKLKVLITCRLEPHLKVALGFVGDDPPESTPGFILEDMQGLINPKDIRSFINDELSAQTIKRQFPGAKWSASADDYVNLVNAAGSLFIVAATMVEFIKDEDLRNPEHGLEVILAAVKNIDKADQRKEFPYRTLDRVYVTILRSSLPTSDEGYFLERYRSVVGAIIFLQQPLRSKTLAALLRIGSDQVDAALRKLTSVIHKANRSPQVYHASFADFVTDRERCAKAEEAEDPVFYIDADKRHARLAELCLDVMCDTLTTRNILNLSDNDWFKDRKDQNVTEKLIGEKISPQLQYACRYWASHFSETSRREEEMVKKLEIFATERLLFWIEALSWTDNLGDGLSALVLGQGWDVPGRAQSLFYDGQRLLMLYYDIIKHAPLHLYSSVLTSIPSQTSLFELYKEKVKKGVEMLSGQPIRWDAALAVLHGHTHWVRSVTFSPDGKQLVSASYDGTVRLWDGVTGKEIATLNGHTRSVTSVTFSPDGKRLASASNDNTVRLWDGVTGKEMATLNGHTSWVRSVTFSPDGKRLASASVDKTVRLWDGVTGKEMATLNGHTNPVRSVTFSPDGKRLASASVDKTVRLWDGVTGKEMATLNGHTRWVRSVTFSPDGKRLASASVDKTVRLWDGVTGKEMATLNGHTNPVRSVTFSPDGKRLASASVDKTVRLWDGVTGKEMATLNGHTRWVRSVTFSPDGKRLASTSVDKTVRLWDTVTGNCLFHWPIGQSLNNGILPVFFSHTLFLPSTDYAGLQPVSLLSYEPPSLGPPLFWLPPWFKVDKWWLLPTGGLFISNREGKVLLLAPVVNSF